MRKIQIYTAFIAVVVLTSLMWYGCAKDEEEEETLGTIYGTVTDFATGDPISNVNVKLLPSGVTTLTGSDGIYEFRELKADRYSLLFSKAEYADLDDNYVIELEAGKKVKRDVQMRKQIASLQIVDMNGNGISSLDFGIEESVTSKSFNIYNNGTLKINCQLSHNCQWIQDVVAAATEIEPGRTMTVTVVIDRTKLLSGENHTFLHIISNNGSNELEITATGYDVPTVTTINATNITTTSATCGGNVTFDGGNAVSERGICWSMNHAPTVESNSKMNLGNGIGSFTGVIPGLTLNTTYYVRAYATNQRGTAYGQEVSFTTADGTPTVITTTPTKTGTTVTTGGNITSDEGSPVTARGVCYSTTPYPDLSDAHNHTTDGSGMGTYSSTFEMTGTGIYYVRAYATNAMGTSYGEQKTINHPYNDLPTFTFNGQTYRVAPPATTTMNWTNANTYCNNLTLYSYDDWRLPSKDELLQMYQDRESIGGFNTDKWWSKTSFSSSYYYYVNFSNGQAGQAYNNSYNGDSDLLFVRPIRVEN